MESIRNLKGSQVISVINTYLIQGNPPIQSLVARIMGKISQPLMKFVNNWIFLGELNDPLEEFFVKENLNILDKDLWFNKYELV